MIKVYTDACIFDNKGGIGIFIDAPNFTNISKPISYNGMTTQSLEMDAVYQAVQMMKSQKKVHIYTDSTHVIDCLITSYDRFEKNGWKNIKNKPIFRSNIIRLCNETIMNSASKGKFITIKYVVGHSGVIGNENADILAGYAAGKINVHNDKIAIQLLNNYVVSNIQSNVLLSSNIIKDSVMSKNKNKTNIFNTNTSIISSIPDSQVYSKIDIWKQKFNISYEDSVPVPSSSKSVTKESVLPILSKSTSIEDYSNSDIYWSKILVMSDTNENINQSQALSDEETNENINIENIVPSIDDIQSYGDRFLFLTCLECTQTVLIKYPPSHIISTGNGIDSQSINVLSLTKCRECITDDMLEGYFINIKDETNKHAESLRSLKISDKLIIGSNAHTASNQIADANVEVLSDKGRVKYIPITIISKLCGRDTRSVTVDVENKKLYDHLKNGFL